MKLLFDQNLSYKLCSRLADLFPDAMQVWLVGLETATDRQIWEYAGTNGFTIVTQDADYANMSALFGSPPKVIWLRCGNQPTSTMERMLRDHIEEIVAFDSDDSLSCLEIL